VCPKLDKLSINYRLNYIQPCILFPDCTRRQDSFILSAVEIPSLNTPRSRLTNLYLLKTHHLSLILCSNARSRSRRGWRPPRRRRRPPPPLQPPPPWPPPRQDLVESRRPTTSWTISRRTLWSRACKCFILPPQVHPQCPTSPSHTPHSIKLSIDRERERTKANIRSVIDSNAKKTTRFKKRKWKKFYR